MKYLHTMIRISNIQESLKFFCDGLGLKETKRMENEKGRYTLIFLAAPNDNNAEIELTYNWDGDNLGEGSRNFGHLAYRVKNIYEICQRLMDMGYTINRPPRSTPLFSSAASDVYKRQCISPFFIFHSFCLF